MVSRDPRIDVVSLHERPLARADMVLLVRRDDGACRLVGRDAHTGQWAGLSVQAATGPSPGGPALVSEAAIRPHALSPDGSLLLFRDSAVGGAGLSLYALATGTAVALPQRPGGRPVQAAFLSEGTRIATLGVADYRASVTVLDIDGGRHRELWSADGGTSSDTVVSWSPDGQFIGVTYVDDEDGDHTVVLDGDGEVLADLPGQSIIGISRLGWLDEHDLVLRHEYWEGPEPPPIVLVDPATGDQRQVTQPEDTGFRGVLDGRVLRPAGRGRIVSTAFDGSDPRAVVDAGPAYEIEFFDAVPGTLAISG
jgi:dipeptidyl aminopeptidase/acylaminoacyl peptidase